LPQHDAVRDFASGNHAPERDEQLAGKGDDHLRLVRPFDTLGSAPEPLRQSAVLLDNWLRVSMGVGGGRYSGIEMMGERSQIRRTS
jgi:hypothetical protein